LTIFREPENYRFVTGRIKHYVKVFDLSVIAYCLMPNHYHLLVRQDGLHSAGLLPQRVFNSYSKAFNKRYGYSGTLFERRFQAKCIERDTHLIHLCRYIHANPVKNGLVSDPAEWPYSNYLEWIGERDSELVDRAFVREQFTALGGLYRDFVREYLRSPQLPPELGGYLERG
jgi:REP element-mobilizing transposase RayT